MNELQAFSMGMCSRDNQMKVFDWDKAATLIKERCGQNVSAGLIEDWSYTSGGILQDGKIIPEDETYVYLSSTWATPIIDIDGQEFECYKMESECPEWNEKTYWPESAKLILLPVEAKDAVSDTRDDAQ